MHGHLNITIDGVDYIAIPRDEYTAYQHDEMLADIRRYDHIKAQLAAGDEEMIPAEFADRILDGESPLRVWCEFRGITLQTLADQVDISKSDLFEMENQCKDGSVCVMKQIAETLRVSLDDIV
ncbi:helix-turn-helix domain-containing protein [Magnetococcales bacterium HHB-1]